MTADPLVNTFRADVLPQAPSPLYSQSESHRANRIVGARLTRAPSCAGRFSGARKGPLQMTLQTCGS